MQTALHPNFGRGGTGLEEVGLSLDLSSSFGASVDEGGMSAGLTFLLAVTSPRTKSDERSSRAQFNSGLGRRPLSLSLSVGANSPTRFYSWVSRLLPFTYDSRTIEFWV